MLGENPLTKEVRSFIEVNKIDKKYNVEFFDNIEKKQQNY